MSAYIVEDDLIKALANYLVSKQESSSSKHWLRDALKLGTSVRFFEDEEMATAIANMLLKENFRSVYARYTDGPKIFGEFEPLNIPLSEYVYKPNINPVQILKMCDCYDYQACENDDYFETIAANAIQLIRKAAIKALPGYDDYEWGYTNPNPVDSSVEVISISKMMRDMS